MGYVCAHWQCTLMLCTKSNCSMLTGSDCSYNKVHKISHMWLTFYFYSLSWSKLYNSQNTFLVSADSNMSPRANLFCSEHKMNWDSRLAFGRTICLLVSFKILFYLDAQIWQWHELQLSASGRRGRSQVKLFQSGPLGEPGTTHTHKPKGYV